MILKADFYRIKAIKKRYDYLIDNHYNDTITELSVNFSEEEIDLLILFRNLKDA